MKKFKHDYYINNQEDEDASTYPLYPEETTSKAKTSLSSVTDHTSSTRKIRDWQKADSRANNNLGEPIIRID
jgi:hypothetical protein